MSLKAKLKLTKINPAYTGPCSGEFSTVTEIVNLNYDPEFKTCETVPVTINSAGDISNYEVRTIKKECNIVNNETVVIYGMSNIGVKQPE